MKHLARLFDIRFLVIFLFSFSIIFVLPSCEEQVDDLWDNDDDSQNVSPLVGDWYADSIKSFYSCVKTLDSTSNVIADSYIENYNLWLLSDGSTQLYFDQSVNLQSECESFYGTWDSNSGCSDSYYEYYDYSPLEFCNVYYEHNQYNIETTDCSQNTSLSGTWTSNETNSTVTIKLDSVCINSFGNPSYISSPDVCNSLEYSEYFEQLEKTFSYSVNSQTGNIDLEGSWFDNDSSCVMLHFSLQ